MLGICLAKRPTYAQYEQKKEAPHFSEGELACKKRVDSLLEKH